jgi:hypothetical protein
MSRDRHRAALPAGNELGSPHCSSIMSHVPVLRGRNDESKHCVYCACVRACGRARVCDGMHVCVLQEMGSVIGGDLLAYRTQIISKYCFWCHCRYTAACLLLFARPQQLAKPRACSMRVWIPSRGHYRSSMRPSVAVRTF